MACNGVGTPRLLLNSVSGRFPNGLANSSGLVGKNLMFHPYAQVYGYVERADRRQPRAADSASGARSSTRPIPSRDFVRGYSIQFGRGAGPVHRGGRQRGQGHAAVGRGSSPRLPQAQSATASAVSAICEDLPEEHNRVTLDPVLKDGHGIPAPKIDYTISENSRQMMDHGIARGEGDPRRGRRHRHLRQRRRSSYGGWHLLGTARMGTDPARSVVNEWGRSHDVKNLFIVDGSIFVTSGGVNPTSTIQAMALYIADQMKQRLANLFD